MNLTLKRATWKHLKQTLAVLILSAFCYTTLAPPYAEASIWAERRKSTEKLSQESRDAKRLTSGRLGIGKRQDKTTHLTQLPSLSPGLLPSLTSGINHITSASDDFDSLTIASKIPITKLKLPLAYTNFRSVNFPKGWKPNDLTVIHIQDVHMNFEAQSNISKSIQELINQEEIDLIALEGAFKDVDVSSFRDFKNQRSIRMAADYFLKEDKLSGAIHTALTSPKEIPPFVGIDDKDLHSAHINAYTESVGKVKILKEELTKEQSKIEQSKATLFNQPLLDFDRQVQAYRNGDLQIGDYIKIISHKPSPTIRTFLQAIEMEESIDFTKVEIERAQLIQSLVQKLSKAKVSHLLKVSLAYRLGKVRHTDFYIYLKTLCKNENINLKNFPAMGQYIHYVILSDQIKSEKLLKEVRKLEISRVQDLAKTQEELKLIAKSRTLYLKNKLLDFALTPEEWDEYKAGVRGWKLGSGDNNDRDDALLSFESFFEHAALRDRAMTENLLKAVQEKKAKTVVLVTGGYHTNGMTRLLTTSSHPQGTSPNQRLNAPAAVITLSPKITKLEGKSGTEYLSVFTQEKAPLEKLFDGDQLFIAAKIDAATFSRVALTTVGLNEALLGDEDSLEDQDLYDKQMPRNPAKVRAKDNKTGATVYAKKTKDAAVLTVETEDGVLKSVTESTGDPSSHPSLLPDAASDFLYRALEQIITNISRYDRDRRAVKWMNEVLIEKIIPHIESSIFGLIYTLLLIPFALAPFISPSLIPVMTSYAILDGLILYVTTSALLYLFMNFTFGMLHYYGYKPNQDKTSWKETDEPLEFKTKLEIGNSAMEFHLPYWYNLPISVYAITLIVSSIFSLTLPINIYIQATLFVLITVLSLIPLKSARRISVQGHQKYQQYAKRHGLHAAAGKLPRSGFIDQFLDLETMGNAIESFEKAINNPERREHIKHEITHSIRRLTQPEITRRMNARHYGGLRTIVDILSQEDILRESSDIVIPLLKRIANIKLAPGIKLKKGFKRYVNESLGYKLEKITLRIPYRREESDTSQMIEPDKTLLNVFFFPTDTVEKIIVKALEGNPYAGIYLVGNKLLASTKVMATILNEKACQLRNHELTQPKAVVTLGIKSLNVFVLPSKVSHTPKTAGSATTDVRHGIITSRQLHSLEYGIEAVIGYILSTHELLKKKPETVESLNRIIIGGIEKRHRAQPSLTNPIRTIVWRVLAHTTSDNHVNILRLEYRDGYRKTHLTEIYRLEDTHENHPIIRVRSFSSAPSKASPLGSDDPDVPKTSKAGLIGGILAVISLGTSVLPTAEAFGITMATLPVFFDLVLAATIQVLFIFGLGFTVGKTLNLATHTKIESLFNPSPEIIQAQTDSSPEEMVATAIVDDLLGITDKIAHVTKGTARETHMGAFNKPLTAAKATQPFRELNESNLKEAIIIEMANRLTDLNLTGPQARVLVRAPNLYESFSVDIEEVIALSGITDHHLEVVLVPAEQDVNTYIPKALASFDDTQKKGIIFLFLVNNPTAKAQAIKITESAGIKADVIVSEALTSNRKLTSSILVAVEEKISSWIEQSGGTDRFTSYGAFLPDYYFDDFSIFSGLPIDSILRKAALRVITNDLKAKRLRYGMSSVNDALRFIELIVGSM